MRLIAWFDTRYALLTMTNSESVILSSAHRARVEGRKA
jgi:hypothetical protein